MNAVSLVNFSKTIALAFFLVLLPSGLFSQHLITQLNPPGYHADYVIITSPDYLSTLEPLAAMRSGVNNLSVGIALTDSIYRWVGNAARPDSAIRAFISFAVAHWSEPKPKYFVLGGNVNAIPSHKEEGINFPGQLSEDSIMVDQWFVEGAGSIDSQGVPLVTIGRLPGWNDEQLGAIVSKTIDYESSPPAAWNARAIAVGDYDTTSGTVFEDLAYRTVLKLGLVWPDTILVYLRYGVPQHRSPAEFRTLLDEGAALVIFSGSADSYRFSRNSYFTTWDVDLLTNNGRLPLCMGLLDQRFEMSETLAVAVRLLTTNQIGAVATLTTCGLTYMYDNDQYTSRVCQALATNPRETVGSVLLAVRRQSSLWAPNDRKEMLLGDPAITIKSPGLASVEHPEHRVPNQFALYQNYPNPFNPSTLISYQIPAKCMMTIVVYDILGREVRTLVHGVQEAGYQSVRFEANRLASGQYICRMVAQPVSGEKSFVAVRRLVVLR